MGRDPRRRMGRKMSNWHKFKTWRDIKKWAEDHKLNHLVARMDLNNDCWNSSGEFGRSQVQICDAIRLAETEDDALEIATQLNEEMEENYGLY